MLNLAVILCSLPLINGQLNEAIKGDGSELPGSSVWDLSESEPQEIGIKLDTFNIMEQEDPETQFMKWLKESGVRTRGIERVRHSNGGRGQTTYIASKNITKGDPILSIPVELAISVHSSKAGRTSIMSEVNPDLPESVILALHLMEESTLGTESKWFPFLRHLPKTLNTTIFFSEEEYSQLRGSQIYRITESRRKAVENMFNALVGPLTSDAVEPPLFTKQQFTQENFKLAISSIWAHSVELRNLHTNMSETVLIPIFDTLPHSWNPETRIGMDAEQKNIVLFAESDISQGSPIRINGGTIDISTFLVTHGYVPEDSDRHILPITIGLDRNDSLYDIKSLIHEKLNTSMDTPYLMQFGKAPSIEMMRSMRIKILQGAEVEKFSNAIANKPVSVRNEYAVYRSILQTCNSLLLEFTTSIEEDQKKLEDPTISDVLRDALRTSIKDKTILKETQDWAVQQWSSLLFSDAI